ncbi:MAG: hypothetical protein ACOYB8_08510 [Eubacteriaceae bacterium]|jgi:hypothetical protein|nr:hypothetical protein [Acholeplasmataceae bacterium]
MFFKTSRYEQFLHLDETGMGYQVIEGHRQNKRFKEKFIVYNSELIVEFDKVKEFKQRTKTEKYSRILNEAQVIYFVKDTISLVPRNKITELRTLNEAKRRDKHRYPNGKGAADNKEEEVNTDGKEVFVRLSAYENDRRIDFVKKKLVRGTYTTTYNDYYVCVKDDDDPIDRYALPNDENVKWAFYVRPNKSDIVQRGIVQPLFGHDGGGIETFFKYGTSENTYYKKTPYGVLAP